MSFLSQIKEKYISSGLLPTIKSIIYWFSKIYLFDKIPSYIIWPFYLLKKKYFEYENKKFKCFFHPYNKTWSNERMVEIAITKDLLKNAQTNKILEIGNVMSHYTDVNHKVLDLYEKGKNVINQDAADIKGLENQFDLIFSISTIEHIGWDCGETKDPEKIKRAIQSIKNCLSDSGNFIFTVPIGYNTFLDEIIQQNFFEEITFLQRNKNMQWEQTNKEFAMSKQYDYPFNAANSIAIIKIYKK